MLNRVTIPIREDYFLLKTVHVIGAAVMLGTGAGNCVLLACGATSLRAPGNSRRCTDRGAGPLPYGYCPDSPAVRGPTSSSLCFNLVAALEFQDVACLIRARNVETETLDDLPDEAHLLRVRAGEPALARPK